MQVKKHGPLEKRGRDGEKGRWRIGVDGEGWDGGGGIMNRVSVQEKGSKGERERAEKDTESRLGSEGSMGG